MTYLGGQTCMALSLLMLLRLVCTEWVILVLRLACNHKKHSMVIFPRQSFSCFKFYFQTYQNYTKHILAWKVKRLHGQLNPRWPVVQFDYSHIPHGWLRHTLYISCALSFRVSIKLHIINHVKKNNMTDLNVPYFKHFKMNICLNSINHIQYQTMQFVVI